MNKVLEKPKCLCFELSFIRDNRLIHDDFTGLFFIGDLSILIVLIEVRDFEFLIRDTIGDMWLEKERAHFLFNRIREMFIFIIFFTFFGCSLLYRRLIVFNFKTEIIKNKHPLMLIELVYLF
jgi:hypothetical protein